MFHFNPFLSICVFQSHSQPFSPYLPMLLCALDRAQCDQIERFIGLWATFQSPWQQLFCPKCQHILGNFCKFVKIFHFTCKILFWATLIDIWRFFTGHTDRALVTYPEPSDAEIKVGKDPFTLERISDESLVKVEANISSKVPIVNSTYSLAPFVFFQVRSGAKKNCPGA